MTNIKEIAKLAGVSVTTVSRVLNSHPYVAADKRERVLEVIEKLDYIPNRSATNLARGKTNTIGVILPYNDHPWFDKIVNGILDTAFKHRYSVTLFPTNYNLETEQGYLMRLKMKQVDGLIITSRTNTIEQIASYAEYGPIVLCEDTDNKQLSCAYIDRMEVFCAGFSYLKDQGYANIYFTSGRPSNESPSTRIKIEAYKRVFGSLRTEQCYLNCYNVQDGIHAASTFFGVTNLKKPVAVYANSDEVAAGFYYYANQNDLEIPTDLAILGQENLPISEVLELTTIDQHLKKLGQNAFEIFKSGNIEKRKISHALIKRKSV